MKTNNNKRDTVQENAFIKISSIWLFIHAYFKLVTSDGQHSSEESLHHRATKVRVLEAETVKRSRRFWAHLVFLIPKADPLEKADAYTQPKGKTKGIHPFVEDACGKNILESCGKIHILKAFDYPGFKMGFCSVARVQIHPGKAGFCGQGRTMAWREG